jgi:pyridoxal 5'-phosphate synthase pdxT subunit
MVVGVLALQGDFARHADALRRAGHAAREIRRSAELADVSGLVLPGGESTTMLRFFEGEPWGSAIEAFAQEGRPILATCAGLILLARGVDHPRQPSLGLLDVDVVRNAYGRQVDSFVGEAEYADGQRCEAVFIRAPKISRLGPDVEIVARCGPDPVCVRQGKILGATFHPELSRGATLHAEAFGD